MLAVTQEGLGLFPNTIGWHMSEIPVFRRKRRKDWQVSIILSYRVSDAHLFKRRAQHTLIIWSMNELHPSSRMRPSSGIVFKKYRSFQYSSFVTLQVEKNENFKVRVLWDRF